jgi:hypothetical protein
MRSRSRSVVRSTHSSADRAVARDAALAERHRGVDLDEFVVAGLARRDSGRLHLRASGVSAGALAEDDEFRERVAAEAVRAVN